MTSSSFRAVQRSILFLDRRDVADVVRRIFAEMPRDRHASQRLRIGELLLLRAASLRLRMISISSVRQRRLAKDLAERVEDLRRG